MSVFCIALSAFIEPESNPPEAPSDPDPDDTPTVEIRITKEPPPPPEVIDAFVRAFRKHGRVKEPGFDTFELAAAQSLHMHPWWIVEQVAELRGGSLS